MAMPKYLTLSGCPAPYMVAPYIYLVTKRAKSDIASIYRGDDAEARAILNRHGKHTQRQLSEAPAWQRAAWGVTGIPNKPGFSQHELRDRNSNPIPSWAVGVDSGPNSDANRRAIRAAAAHYGLHIEFPYPAGVEYHHWHFVKQPVADGKHLYKAQVVAARAYLRTKR